MMLLKRNLFAKMTYDSFWKSHRKILILLRKPLLLHFTQTFQILGRRCFLFCILEESQFVTVFLTNCVHIFIQRIDRAFQSFWKLYTCEFTINRLVENDRLKMVQFSGRKYNNNSTNTSSSYFNIRTVFFIEYLVFDLN